MNNINTLLKRYLDKTASEEERFQLYKLLASGKHDEDASKAFETMLHTLNGSAAASPDQEKVFTKIFNAIMTDIRAREDHVRVHVKTDTPGLQENGAARYSRANPRTEPAGKHRVRAVIAMAVLAVAVAAWLLSGAGDLWKKQETAEEVVTIAGTQYIHLPDGSTVLLDEGSTLRYNEIAYGNKEREVTLSGQAFFDVKADSGIPFVVRTETVSTTVLGTAFNINAELQQKKVRVTVVKGKVKVNGEQYAYGTIMRGHQIAVNTASGDFINAVVNVDTVLQWKNKYLILDRVTLADAASSIAEKYNVTVTVDSTLENRIIEAAFMKGENLEQVLSVLTIPIGAAYTNDNKKVTITNATKEK